MLSPLLTGSGVLHIKGTMSLRNAQGKVIHKCTIEFWYDRANGDARLEVRHVLGKCYDGLLFHQRGMTSEGGGGAFSRSYDQSGPMTMPVIMMFYVQWLFHRGFFVPATDVPAPPGQMVIVKPVPEDKKYTAFLDKRTQLVLKIINLYDDMSAVYTYPVIETVDRASLPADFFDMFAQPGVPPIPTDEPAVVMPPGATVVLPSAVSDQPTGIIPAQSSAVPTP